MLRGGGLSYWADGGDEDMKSFGVWDLIVESNRIEGIDRNPTEAELEEYHRFQALDAVEIEDIMRFVTVHQPGAELRERPGMNVQVGSYIPPSGDITIKTRLQDILTDANIVCSSSLRNALEFTEFEEKMNACSPYKIHHRYEKLHPFMDGNGRSGRMLWMWMMEKCERNMRLGFLHTWYYQSLNEGRNV